MCLYAVRIQPNLKPVPAYVDVYLLPTLVWLEDDGVKEVLVFFDLGFVSSEDSCNAKVPHFKYAVKTTQLPKKTVTELTWCSARMFNCNEFNPVILINFVNGIQFLKTSWQQIPQWKKNDATRGGIYLLKLYFFHYLLSIPWGLTQLLHVFSQSPSEPDKKPKM